MSTETWAIIATFILTTLAQTAMFGRWFGRWQGTVDAMLATLDKRTTRLENINDGRLQ